jgi:hypothetical protein
MDRWAILVGAGSGFKLSPAGVRKKAHSPDFGLKSHHKNLLDEPKLLFYCDHHFNRQIGIALS